MKTRARLSVVVAFLTVEGSLVTAETGWSQNKIRSTRFLFVQAWPSLTNTHRVDGIGCRLHNGLTGPYYVFPAMIRATLVTSGHLTMQKQMGTSYPRDNGIVSAIQYHTRVVAWVGTRIWRRRLSA
jgi:hypothetical protein